MKVLPPTRVTRTRTIRLHAKPEDVFPLFCPVREVEWVEGWDPEVVYSTSGLVEADCIFVTREAEERAIWAVIRHDAERFALDLLKVAPEEAVTRIEVRLEAAGGNHTDARIAYTHTALGPRGSAQVERFTEERYGKIMETWRRVLNHYLETGSAMANE